MNLANGGNDMKTYKFASVFSALFIVILCMSLFTACQRVAQIEANEVERIAVWTQITEECELNADDSAKFIELFNSSKYEGKGTGEGGTPEFGICVYFHDGTYLRANDFSGFAGRDFEVSFCDSDGNKKEWYYISSKEFYTFVLELANKSTEPSS